MSDKFDKFAEVIKRLRDPDSGCPWDIKQTHQSIRQYFVEEVYEALDAIDQRDDAELCKELGDVLLQIALHSQIAADRGAFTLEDVVEAITEKMIRRHPHVFGEVSVKDADEVVRNWEQIKREEQNTKSLTASLENIPKDIPALHRAFRLGSKASKLRFDWNSKEGVLDKLEEEVSELREALSDERLDAEQRSKALEHELGDVLFVLCQLARWIDLNPEDSLRAACSRFLLRFKTMEQLSEKPFEQMECNELDQLWEQAKEKLKHLQQ